MGQGEGKDHPEQHPAFRVGIIPGIHVNPLPAPPQSVVPGAPRKGIVPWGIRGAHVRMTGKMTLRKNQKKHILYDN